MCQKYSPGENHFGIKYKPNPCLFTHIYSDAPYCSISEIYEGSKYVKTEVEKRSRVTPSPFSH